MSPRKRYVLHTNKGRKTVLTGRERAWHLLSYNIAKGYILRVNLCEHCGKIGPTDAHHNDYAYPLEVSWLCRQCHSAWHVKRRKGHVALIDDSSSAVAIDPAPQP